MGRFPMFLMAVSSCPRTLIPRTGPRSNLSLAAPADDEEQTLVDFAALQLRLRPESPLDALTGSDLGNDEGTGTDSGGGTDATTDAADVGTDSGPPPASLCGTYPGELFCDGFETGTLDMPPWLLSSMSGPSASWSVQGAETYRGGSALKLEATGSADWIEIRAPVPGVPSSGTLAVRAWVLRPAAEPPTDAELWFLQLEPVTVDILMFPSSGNDRIWVIADNPGMFYASTADMPHGAWACFEVIVELDSGAAGSVEVRLNDFLILLESGIQTVGPGGVTSLELKIHGTAAGTLHEMYWDELVIADQPIGCD